MQVRKFYRILSVLLFLAAWSCSKETDTPVTPDPEPEPTPVETGKPRYVWIDASANFNTFANSKANIASEVKRLAGCGFTDIIVDVRPTEGTVLFPSKLAPEAKRLAAWVGSSYKFITRTATFDYLQAFIDAGHSAGLRVNAAMNTFVGGYGGYYGLDSEGPIFTGAIPAEWATMQNASDGVKSSYSSSVQGTVFLNPVRSDVQEYLLNIIGELASYDLDGIILDRCRYDDSGLQSDFSDESKAAFTAYLGAAPSKWPVFNAGTEDLPSSLSTEQKSWMSFRVKVIHDFVEKAAAKVHSVNQDMRFGCYVGAWYDSYYPSGVNWASPRYNARASYKWADADYQTYGYADHCDFMMLGCYASASGIYGSAEWTMQGFCKKAKEKLMGDTSFAGGPDIGNPTGWTSGGQGSKIWSTVDACINAADGYFVFDLCHIRMYDYWDAFKQAFEKYESSINL